MLDLTRRERKGNTSLVPKLDYRVFCGENGIREILGCLVFVFVSSGSAVVGLSIIQSKTYTITVFALVHGSSGGSTAPLRRVLHSQTGRAREARARVLPFLLRGNKACVGQCSYFAALID